MPNLKTTFIRINQWVSRIGALLVLGSVRTLRLGSGAGEKQIRVPEGIVWEAVDAGGVRCEWLNPPGALPGAVLLDLHGGGGVLGLYNSARKVGGALALTCNLRTLLPDYRLAPEYPYPAGLDDCVTAYRWLLSEGTNPQRIVIEGDSMGGYFTICSLLKIRAAGLPLPAAAVCISPNTDPTCSGGSMKTNAWRDALLSPQFARKMMSLHVGDHDLGDPFIAPLTADLHGLPPILVQVGEDEILLDDSRRFCEAAQAAGGDVTLDVWPHMWHVWHLCVPDLPEATQAIGRIAGFINSHI